MFTEESLNIISVNFFSILFSLLNLVIIFLIAKFLLYKPVKKMLQNRQKTIDESYQRARDAENEANAHKEAYEEKLESAKNEANNIISGAVITAKAREKEILAGAKNEGERIVAQAKESAELEIKKAEKTIKDEIVDVSLTLTEKLLEREINEKDHDNLIDSFIDEIGEE